ncbi:MAG TPA: PilZ domain-containing protein [Candidatus Angelobacter sp.]|nr:PilZ domain-containing protein [Candidatus Angelobacter sp.]
MPDVMSNRRNSPRFALILVAVLTEVESDTRLSARTSDVSRTGCYVDTLNPIPQGKLVSVVLSRGEEFFESRGRVMYVSPGLGMGIRFEEPVAPHQLEVLNRWLEKSAHLRL